MSRVARLPADRTPEAALTPSPEKDCLTCGHEWQDHNHRGCEVRYKVLLPLEDGICSCRAATPSPSEPSPAEGLRLDGLRVLRVTGEQLNAISEADSTDYDSNADAFAVDWDEFDEFVLLDDVRALTAEPDRPSDLDAARRLVIQEAKWLADFAAPQNDRWATVGVDALQRLRDALDARAALDTEAHDAE